MRETIIILPLEWFLLKLETWYCLGLDGLGWRAVDLLLQGVQLQAQI